MAYQAVNGLYYPIATNTASPIGGTIYTSILMDGSGDKVAFIFVCPKDGDLNLVGFLTGTVTLDDDLKVGFQDVDAATGDPDGTFDQYRVITIAITDDDVWKETGLITTTGADGGAKRTVTKGQKLALVLEYNSYVAGNLNIKIARQVGALIHDSGQHYIRANLSGAYAAQASLGICIALQYSDGAYYYIDNSYPFINTTANLAVNTGTTPDEVGLYFSVPFACKVDGIKVGADFDGNADIILYDTNGTSVLATSPIDKDIRGGATSQYFDTAFAEVTLTPGSFYRAVIKPSSATTVTVPYMDFNSNAILGQISGGINCYWTQRTDAGSWSQTTTRRPNIHLRISALSDGAADGSGGGGASIQQIR